MKQISLLITLFCAFLVQSQNITSSLQACYPLNGNSQNYATTGSAMDGTLTNVTPAVGHTGLPNTAYKFNGSVGSYIKLPDHPGLKSNDVFFSGWIRVDSLPFLQYLVYTSNGCFNNFEAYSLLVFNNQGNHVFRANKCGSNCTTKPEINSTTSVVIGNWYHVCFFVSNSVIKLYVNGNLESSIVHNVPFGYQPGSEVFLGVTNQNNYNLPFKGAMDNIRFYDRELTQQEVNILYSQDPACSEVAVSIDDHVSSASDIKVFPNPATDRLCVENPGQNILIVCDLLGRPLEVPVTVVSDHVSEFSLQNLNPGIYVMKIVDSEGNCQRNLKIIKN